MEPEINVDSLSGSRLFTVLGNATCRTLCVFCDGVGLEHPRTRINAKMTTENTLPLPILSASISCDFAFFAVDQAVHTVENEIVSGETLRGRKVLVVDDAVIFLSLATRILEPTGAMVLTARNGVD